MEPSTERRSWVVLIVALMLTAGSLAFAGGVAAEDHDESDPDEHDDDVREADDHDDDDERDDDHDEDDRDDDRARHEVSTEVSGSEAQIELEREDATSERKVQFGLSTGDEVEIDVEYETENATGEVEEKLEAEFHRLIEYVDSNGNGKYDAGEPIASSWALGGDRDHDDDDDHDDGDDGPGDDLSGHANGTVTWRPLTADQVASDDGTAGTHIEARATFGPDGNATFGLDLFVFGDFAQVHNATLQPTELKIDILIDDYPYVRDDTALALIMSTETEREVEGHSDSDEEGVVATGSIEGVDFRLEFTWKDTASVDGSDEPVRSTLLSSKTKSEVDGDGSEAKSERTFALSYARGDHIVHDPKAGVHYTTASDGTAGTPALGVVFTVGALGAVAAALATGRRRR